MNDALRTGIGGDSTDVSLRSIRLAKPLWILEPLPLSQVQPGSTAQSIPFRMTASLQSACLATISLNLSLYSPAALGALPPHLFQRVISRIRTDRRYQDESVSEASPRPDEATVWMYEVLAQPESAMKQQHTVALPMDNTLMHLARNPLLPHPDHPLNEFPRLYAALNPRPNLTLLTTLSLNGMNSPVDDSTVQALKWCSHLTALWTRSCPCLTDDGVRQLATSLVLPGNKAESEARGMWRLRAWWLHGCRGVSDRSLKSFARWPGLVVLDLRDTSCTEFAVDVFNRANQTTFCGLQPEFQACTTGLRGLFSTCADPDVVLHRLCLTLLKPAVSSSTGDTTDDMNEHRRRYLALHVAPSTMPLRDEWLPERTRPIPQGTPDVLQDSSTSSNTSEANSVYCGDGIGQIYGAGVSNVPDMDRTIRTSVKVALDLQAEKEHVAAQRAVGRRGPKMRGKRKQRNDTSSRASSDHSAYPTVHITGKVYEDEAAAADERSRAFVSRRFGRVVDDNRRGAPDIILGASSVMLVRMVHPEWARLTWTAGPASQGRSSLRLHTGSSAQAAAVRTRSAPGIISDILAAQLLSAPGQGQSHSHSHSQPPSSSPLKSQSQSTPSSRSQTSSQSQSRSPLPVSERVVPSPRPLTPTPKPAGQKHHRTATHDPFRRVVPRSTAMQPLDPSTRVHPLRPPVSSYSDAEPPGPWQHDDLSFARSGRTRAFDGESNSNKMKRRGLKMFGGSRV